MTAVTDFYRGIQSAINTVVERVKPYRASVASTANGLVRIQPLEADAPLDESYARLTGLRLATGDEVAIITLADQPFVLGKIRRSSSSGESLDVPIGLTDGVTLKGYTGAPSGTPTFTIDASTGTVTANSFNSPLTTAVSQSSSDTSSTTSTSTYQTAVTTSLALPAGTWKVVGVGGAQFTHSASGSVNFRLAIGGTAGSGRSFTFNNTVFGMGIDNAEVSGLSGTINLVIEYCSNTAGTTSSKNPWLMAIATRTS